ALNKTQPGGEVQSLDSANYGSAIITRAVTITGAHGVSGMLSASLTGITVNAGTTDVINLRGLEIDGGGSGINGILFTSGGSLNIDDTVIRGFANGVTLSSTNPNTFTVNNTSIFANTVGLSVQSPVTTTGALTGTLLVNNGTGVSAVGASSSSPANL